MNTPAVVGGRYVIRLGKRAPSYSHGFREGEEVFAVRPDSADPDAWHCQSISSKDNRWWVHVRDLEDPNEPEVTEQEVLQVFGLVPQPHCTTCTCYQD